MPLPLPSRVGALVVRDRRPDEDGWVAPFAARYDLVAERAGEVVGSLALALDEARATGELAWAFADGVDETEVTGAVADVLSLALDHHGLHRVVARTDPRDERAGRVAEAVGLRREGVARHDRWAGGRWHDSVVHAALGADAPRRAGAIVVSAVTLRDADGQVLTVRKRGTSLFMQPGGKPEPGESAHACAVREVEEELGLRLDPALLRLVGVHRTAAANEAGQELLATVFEHPALEGHSAPVVHPAAEIEQVRWLDPREPLPDDLAPLLLLLLER
ncbi:GNAT family N-acetyltransferase [Janibacter sp. Y6]|uniref:GNAT family N-acetyltransferase n=1 Tax=Janibacter sp. Y6 TaxID=2913552 RepID=UPI0034A45694